MPAQLIAIDWGTTNCRAYLLADAATILQREISPSGIANIKKDDFPHVFQALVGTWLQQFPQIPVILSGMVGSINGWQPVDYLSCPASLSDLAQHLFAFAPPPLLHPLHIVPGIKLDYKEGWCDIMRGEETAIYGATRNKTELFCIPGTHSKWVEIKNNLITHFTTYMTGELYALLKNYSILQKQIQPSPFSQSAFIMGLNQVQNHAGFLANLFNIRAQTILQRLAPEHITDYLSGLIIGYELKDSRCYWDEVETVTLIADDILAERYQIAIEQHKLNTRLLSSEYAVTQGLWKIAQEAHLLANNRSI